MHIPEFHDRILLVTALTHRSAINEHATAARESNERLEYLGDAVLELLVTDFLYHRLPGAPEGKMTSLRSNLVKTTALADAARRINLGDLIYVSRGEEGSSGRIHDAILADSMEALIGAIYLDQGLECARRFISETILSHFDELLAQKTYKDPKSHLQELAQSLGYTSPTYTVVDSADHDPDTLFTLSVSLDDEVLATGDGHNKKDAQQAAAAAALAKIGTGELILHRNPAKTVL